jgi:hypothetical protein
MIESQFQLSQRAQSWLLDGPGLESLIILHLEELTGGGKVVVP